jgi:MFS family permease
MTQSVNPSIAQFKPSRLPFTTDQRKILVALASTVGLRMLGLFLVLPVFTLYGLEFTSSRFLVGFAFGCYGLTMAILQIPLGRLSDHIGRRKVLLLGMTLFSAGSFLCALPHWFPRTAQIGVLIVGRLVQGCGAIISTAFAAVADHIEPERRSTAMAVLGIPIGAAFAVGVIGGPLLAGIFGTAFLFWVTGFLGIGTDLLLLRYLPDVPPHTRAPAPVVEVLGSRALWAFSLGGFLINFFMSTFFFYFPLIMTERYRLKINHYSFVLLPMILVSGITMFGFSRGADRGWGRSLAAIAFLIFLPSALLLFRPQALGADPNRLAGLLIAGTLFYIAFTGLEPILPSLVSKFAPASAYGTALGFYNTTQFLGSAVGGPTAGALARYPSTYVMAVFMGGALLGFLLMLSSRPSTKGS